ncbi:hypothetical protein B1A85_20550 [Chroococcidiopsis sp. TS-821]|nr:hypothetical protein B1A85_20550 [Chroococcidiopsis sp. TS-821]
MKESEQSIKNAKPYNTFERIFYLFLLIFISILGIVIILPLFLIKQVFNLGKNILKYASSKDENNSQV